MKKTFQLVVLLLFLALGTAQVFSQGPSDIAPLLRPDTIAVAHLNLKNFDFDRFAESQVEQIDTFFQRMNYDHDSREAISREAKTLITGKLNFVRPIYQMFVMATKLEDIYAISYAGGLEAAPVIVATPLAGKSRGHIALLESLFADAPIKPFQWNGFLVLAVPGSPDKGQEAVEWVKKNLGTGQFVLNQSLVPVVEEAFQDDDSIFRAVVLIPENIQEWLVGVDLSQVPPQALVMLDMILEKFRWISFGVDVYTLSAELTVQTSSEEDAEELLELFRAMQDMGIETMRIGMLSGISQGAQENPALLLLTEYVPLLTEIARGAVRQMLPLIDEAKLIFRL